MTLIIVSRSVAVNEGLPRYFTGVACKNGHISERYTANKTCITCANATAEKTKSKDKDKYIASSVAWGKRNPAKLAKYQRTKNAKRPGERNLWTMNYRSAKSERMPDWLNDGQIFEMECVYTYCSALRKAGLDYHVDHVVPLRGETVF